MRFGQRLGPRGLIGLSIATTNHTITNTLADIASIAPLTFEARNRIIIVRLVIPRLIQVGSSANVHVLLTDNAGTLIHGRTTRKMDAANDLDFVIVESEPKLWTPGSNTVKARAQEATAQTATVDATSFVDEQNPRIYAIEY